MNISPIWKLLMKRNRSLHEDMLLQAICIISSINSNLTPEQIWDKLAHDAPLIFGSTEDDCHTSVQPIVDQLKEIKATMTTMNDALSRLQNDQSALATSEGNLVNLFQQLLDANAAMVTRLEADIDKLRNANPGDPTIVNQVADSLEQNKAQLDNVTSRIQQAIDQANQTDVQTGGGTGGGSTLTIDPPTVSMLRTATQQFTASDPSATFSAQSGQIDPQSGLYTPPADGTITSDTVTAKLADGTTATASVSISG